MRIRTGEARNAMRALGIASSEFLGFPDRELFLNMESAKLALRAIIGEFRPDVIYSPSVIELHPDHRAAAEILISLRNEFPVFRCLFYEVLSPFRPNIFVDVTSTYRYKEKAVKCYKSQLKLSDYLGMIRSLNAYRSFIFGRGVKYVEAFWEVGMGVTREDMRLWLGYESPLC